MICLSLNIINDSELAMAALKHEGNREQAPWGSVVFRRFVFNGNLPATRIYSPDFLRQVFNWNPLQDEWDGLLCEIEPPSRVNVRKYRMPICLKWRSESEEALRKKARGITSLLWRFSGTVRGRSPKMTHSKDFVSAR
jgi:hypothetical protein